jgi:hypothetical protein
MIQKRRDIHMYSNFTKIFRQFVSKARNVSRWISPKTKQFFNWCDEVKKPVVLVREIALAIAAIAAAIAIIKG